MKSRELRDGGAEGVAGQGLRKDILFDRVGDVSKIYGCNTRNVRYRWSIFSDALTTLELGVDKTSLDFGAGSLKDTWELTSQGFHVVALDLNAVQLKASYEEYDWSGFDRTPELLSCPIDGIDPDWRFDLITAFDVVEHLTELDQSVEQLIDHLSPVGLALVTVPNGRSLRERVGKIMYIFRKVSGILDANPGVHHVNFKSPEDWRAYFVSKGFVIHRHDMAIGSLVNNWHFIHFFPLGITGLAARFPALEYLFCPAWFMKRLDILDQNLKRWTKSTWGWNLFVMGKSVRQHRVCP